jgi:hypothetical protein
MTNRNVSAFLLAGAAMLIVATPASAAARTKSAAPAYRGAVASESYPQGSRRTNRDGASFRTPEACAYPLRYDSTGVPVFQRQGCRLP